MTTRTNDTANHAVRQQESPQSPSERDFLPLTIEDLDRGLTDEQFAWIAAHMNLAVVATDTAQRDRSDAA